MSEIKTIALLTEDEHLFNLLKLKVCGIEDCPLEKYSSGIELLEAIEDHHVDEVYLDFTQTSQVLMLCGKLSRYSRVHPIHIVTNEFQLNQAKDLVADMDFVNVISDETFLAREIVEPGKSEATDSASNNYLKMDLIFLLSKGKVKCDVYILLGENKYVKVFNLNDEFSGEEIAKYSDRYNNNIYVKEPDFLELSKQVAKELSGLRLEERKSLATDACVEISMKSFEISKQLIEKLDMSQEVCELTSAAIDATLRAVSKSKEVMNLLKQAFKCNAYITGHSQALAFVACGLAQALGWNSKQTYKKLCLAAYFHDITVPLDDMAKIDDLEEAEAMDEEYAKELGIKTWDEIKDMGFSEYKNHPEEAAKLLKHLEGDQGATEMIILQHHERQDGTGFPNGLNHQKISPLSMVFIISHKFVDEVYKEGLEKSNRRHIIDKMLKHYTAGKFKKTVEGLPLVFRKKNSLKKAA